jgi:RecA/RadA recombinase
MSQKRKEHSMNPNGANNNAANSANRAKALEAALGQIERQFGKGTVMRMGDSERVAIPSISTGSLGLDVALGIGGLPKGRICEIFGPESSGKTTLTLQVIAEAQKAGGHRGLYRCRACARPDLRREARRADRRPDPLAA